MLRTLVHRITSAFAAAPPREDWRGWNSRLRQARQIQAAYEAAIPRDDLWTLADFKDADAALLPEIRRRIRSRARYERANNPLIERVLGVWVEDVVGDGPWLEAATGDPVLNSFIESAWSEWWEITGQGATLATAVEAEAVDGEVCGVLMRNFTRVEDQHADVAVSLDVRLFEADRLASPHFENANRSDYVDGVHLDPLTGTPLAYDLLKAHPGTEYLDAVAEMFEHETFSADEFLHAFARRRPEQHRGVSRFIASLPIAGHARKYVESEATRLQIVAALAFLLKSSAPPEEEGGEGDESDWWQTLNLLNRQAIGAILPDGYEPVQLKADGAAGNLEVMNRVIAGHVAGCFQMPLGHALGAYGTSGYAPIRAEMAAYQRTINAARRQVWTPLWLRPLYRAWIAELTRTPGWRRIMSARAADSPPPALTRFQFKWPGRELIVDPSREEESRRKRLAMGLTTREDEVDAADLDAHDRRAAAAIGLGSDDAGLRRYRQLCGAFIHQVPLGDPPSRNPPPESDD